MARGIVYDANASASMSALGRLSSYEDLVTVAAYGGVSKNGPAYKMQFPANDMMAGGDMPHKRSAHELQFPANDMMSGGDGR